MSENNVQKEKPQQNIGELLKIRRDKLAELQNEGENPFALTSYDQDTHTADIIDNFDNMDGKTVSIAGRLMSKRVMGKASFFDLRDRTGKLQLYVARDELGVQEV